MCASVRECVCVCLRGKKVVISLNARPCWESNDSPYSANTLTHTCMDTHILHHRRQQLLPHICWRNTKIQTNKNGDVGRTSALCEVCA